jgi:GTP-binding protein
MTQASIRPPSFVAFTNRRGELHFSHNRYLVNQIRKKFGFKGTPVVLTVKAKGAK